MSTSPLFQNQTARRQLIALVTTAFIVLQSVLFAVPTATAQRRSLRKIGSKRFAPLLSITTLGVPITENFDTLPASGSATWTNDTTLPGWYHARTGTGTTIVANNGSSNAGNLYSYGTGTDAERALGSVGSGNAAIGNLFWGILLTNTTGSTITSLDVSYTGEQWRNSAAAAQTVTFSYIDGAGFTGSLANFQAAGTNVPALDFTSPITGGAAGALDGNLAANRVALSSNIPVTIPNNGSIVLRWSDPDHTGADHGLAIDNFSVTASDATPTPTLSVDDVSQAEGNSGTSIFTFTVSLTSAAGPSGVTFDIATADGTAQDGNPGGEDNDYVAKSETGRTIASGNSSASFTVTVNGDTASEPTEAFFVNVTNVTGATAGDVQGMGTISNDEVSITPIHTIQGSGTASPLDGQAVTTTGVVTLLKTGSNSGGPASGFFLQASDADVDADPNTSEGIFVFTSSVPTVAVGEEINVTGTVDEFNGLTEITVVTNISVIDTGNPLPTAVTLTTTILDPAALPTQPQLEKFEGMRMTAPSLTVVAPNDTFFDVETVITGVARPLREPGIEVSLTVPPDPTTGVPDCCIPLWDENPERLKVDTNARAGAPLNAFTSSVIFTSVAGPLDFAFAEYRLIPDVALTASANLSAVPAPTPTGNEFLIAGYNIENFNNDATQRQKAALTIRDVMRLPDIVGAIEIFDLADLQALATEINSIAPGSTYQAFLVEADGTSEDSDQDVGFLVDTSRVQVNSVTQRNATETFINPNNGQPELLNDRPPLVLDANVEPAGRNVRVIVIVNHLRSFIDIETVTGEGPRVRAKRKAQGESLAALLQEYQTNNPTTSVISVGDYNAYQFNDGYTDPIATIKGNPTPDDQVVVDGSPDVVNPNFINLVDGLPADERYSFIFEGTPQALDHVILNTVAQALNTRFAIARVNADFPEVPAATFASNASRPERNSDHDPAIAYFSLGAQPVGSVIISEFRFRGPFNGMTPNGALDEYVELYNNTNTAITVSSVDGTSGWALAYFDSFFNQETIAAIIPNGTVIPARGHYLIVNEPSVNGNEQKAPRTSQIGEYTLDSYAEGDLRYHNFGSTEIPNDGAIALFQTSNQSNFSLSTRLDAASLTSVAGALADLYREGTNLPSPGANDGQYAFVRKLVTGLPQDTNNNAADFVFVSTDGASYGGVQSQLGAPGPQNTLSPIQRNSTIKPSLIEPLNPSSASPNRVRDLTPVTNGAQGTLSVRRRFTNQTGATVTRLRFRVVDITTLNSPGYTLGGSQADIRVIDGVDFGITTSLGVLTVRGLTIEQPSPLLQSNGGGLNSSVTVAIPGGALANGASIDVHFLLGVQQGGIFRAFFNVEGLP